MIECLDLMLYSNAFFRFRNRFTSLKCCRKRLKEGMDIDSEADIFNPATDSDLNAEAPPEPSSGLEASNLVLNTGKQDLS